MNLPDMAEHRFVDRERAKEDGVPEMVTWEAPMAGEPMADTREMTESKLLDAQWCETNPGRSFHVRGYRPGEFGDEPDGMRYLPVVFVMALDHSFRVRVAFSGVVEAAQRGAS